MWIAVTYKESRIYGDIVGDFEMNFKSKTTKSLPFLSSISAYYVLLVVL
jgi:hypothetical protein